MTCATAIAGINVLIEGKLPERAAGLGEYLISQLKKSVNGYEDNVLEVRDKGLLIGIEFASDRIDYETAKGLLDKGILVAGTLINAKTIRIEPPLTIEREQCDTVCAVFRDVLETLCI